MSTISTMENTLGQTVVEFEAALTQFREALSTTPELYDLVFDGTEDWSNLLTYKLVPHLSGEGCLVAAVAGGTNTGKSTVFNLLLGRTISPMVNTAAATCHPVIAANERRAVECMESKLVPEFRPQTFDRPDDATDSSIPHDAIFVTTLDSLPDHLIIMDTPDVDSIDKRNWEVADHIRAAGDVMVAVLTGEKYKDDRVVQFFREAAASGRVILPVMNKANPADDFAVARKQLAEFLTDVDIDGPCFVIPHDFTIGDDLNQPILSLDGHGELLPYLIDMDVVAIKETVFQGTVVRFFESVSGFMDHAERTASDLSDITHLFENMAHEASREYQPAPGKEVGGLFHEFVQSKRGTLRHMIGSASTTVVRGAAAIGKGIMSGFTKRATLESDENAGSEEELVAFHRDAIERIARNLAAHYIETGRTLSDPAAGIVAHRFEAFDVEAAVNAVVEDTLQTDNISDEFREHANATLDAWWADNKGKRMALEALDTVLAVMPAAIAGVTTVITSGFGAGEIALASTAAGAAFGAKVMEYQFGDAMFDFLSPWKLEQQDALNEALQLHITQACLEPLYSALEPFQGDTMDTLRTCLAQHHTAETTPEEIQS